jgi:hypothetical protein
MTPLEPFYAANPCPNCDGRGASYKFHGPACEQFGADGEHMHRQCPRCGHEWAERARQTLRRAQESADT